MDKILVAVIGFIGGVIAALISAGILFPPNEWSHPLEKSATDNVQVTIPPAPYEREISVEGYVSGLATHDKSHMFQFIKINNNQCNTKNKIYKTKTAEKLLEGNDFCLINLSKNTEATINVGTEQWNIESKLARMVVRLKRKDRSLF